jgi:hypothetical protein
MTHRKLTIRATTKFDHDALTNMSAVGYRRYGFGRGLVAEIDGEAIAAISLTNGGVVADLHRAHPRVVQSLRRRRYQILRQGGDVGRSLHLLRRLAPPRSALQESPA